jgi:hypothetical protein
MLLQRRVYQGSSGVVGIDYLAVSLPDFLLFEDDLQARHRAHCLYMTALGHLGIGDVEAAIRAFNDVLALDPAPVGATIHHPESL